MAIKTQGNDINRVVTNFLDVADFGAFNTGHSSIILRGDSARKINITGFVFTMRVGIVGDVNAANNIEVLCAENFLITANSGIAFFPDINSSLRFAFSEPASFFQNEIQVQFNSPFKLLPSVTYSFVGAVQFGAVAPTATVTTRFTVFGFEDEPIEQNQFYTKAR